MNGRSMFVRVAAPAVVAAALCTCSPDAPQARSWSIDLHQLQYVPASLEVSVGDTVRWINRDPLPHTVTAPDSAWDSGRMDRGEVWSVVVTAAHEGEYVCTFHLGMTGMLRIER